MRFVNFVILALVFCTFISAHTNRIDTLPVGNMNVVRLMKALYLKWEIEFEKFKNSSIPELKNDSKKNYEAYARAHKVLFDITNQSLGNNNEWYQNTFIIKLISDRNSYQISFTHIYLGDPTPLILTIDDAVYNKLVEVHGECNQDGDYTSGRPIAFRKYYYWPRTEKIKTQSE